jgi:hypothetical protein
MSKGIAALLFAALLLAPLSASRSQAASLSQQHLDRLNRRVFTDAWVTAKIIGHDRSEIEQLKADVRVLKDENAQLRVQLIQPRTVSATASSGLESRIAALEAGDARYGGQHVGAGARQAAVSAKIRPGPSR